MDTELEHPSERLDPLVLGVLASAPLADATRRALLAQQTACAAVETAEKMAERARLMFTTLENGPHPSGMLTCRLTATNGLLELVSKAAHTIWTSHRSEIRVMCPELWDEELMRGWLLMDSTGRWLASAAAFRTVGKRAAAQVWSASGRAKAQAKRARTNAPRPEDRDAAAEAARKEVWAEAYSSLMENVPSRIRPARPSGAATVAAAKPAALALAPPSPPPPPPPPPPPSRPSPPSSPPARPPPPPPPSASATTSAAAATTPTTCPAGEARPAGAVLTEEDCRLLRFEASEHSAQLAEQAQLVKRLEAQVERLEAVNERLEERVEEMYDERAPMLAESTERSRQWCAQVEAHRVMLEEGHAREEEYLKWTDALEEALGFAQWTIEGGHRPLTAWLPNRWWAEELTEEEASPAHVSGTVFYQKVATDETTWDHPCPQLWDDVWQVAYGTGDRPPAYEKYCRRYEDDPDEL